MSAKNRLRYQQLLELLDLAKRDRDTELVRKVLGQLNQFTPPRRWPA